MTTEKEQVYKCRDCGDILEVLHEGKGDFMCCGKPMELVKANKKEDEGSEKHVPVLKKEEGKITVEIGEVEHPMEKSHYIEWIEILHGDTVYRKFLKPDDDPKATFNLNLDVEDVKAREHCSVHGLWTS